MYVGVKLLYKHEGTPQGYLTKRFPSPSSNDMGEKSLEKVRQNNMVLRMNATFLKVLREVLLGLPIMEPNVKKRCRKIRRSPIPSQSRFALGCHA